MISRIIRYLFISLLPILFIGCSSSGHVDEHYSNIPTPVCTTIPTPANIGDAITTTCSNLDDTLTVNVDGMVCTEVTTLGDVTCTGIVGQNTLDSDKPVKVTDATGQINDTETIGLEISKPKPPVVYPQKPHPLPKPKPKPKPILHIDNLLMGDNLFNKIESTHVIISGTTDAEDGQMIDINIDGIKTQATSHNGVWTTTMDLTSLNDGDLKIKATVTNKSGQISTLITHIIKKDTYAPTTTTGGITSPKLPDNNPHAPLTGTCGSEFANGSVEITTNPTAMFTSYPATATLDNQGHFNITNLTWRDGSFTLNINCTDEAGNGPSIVNPKPTVTIIGEANASSSTLSATPNTVKADAHSIATITVTLKDKHGVALISGGDTVSLHTTGSATLSNIIDNENGTYTATILDSVEEIVTILATVNGKNIIQTVDIEFTANNIVDANQSTLTANQSTRVANGTEMATLTVTAKDATGNPITGATVSMAQSGDSNISTVTDNGDGTYSFDVTSTTAETVTYTATIDGVVITQTVDVTFTPDFMNPGSSSVVASPTTITADGVSSTTITVTLKDTYGNLILDGNVSLDQDGSSTISDVTNNNDGTYTFTATSLTAQIVEYTGRENGIQITQKPSVEFTAGEVDNNKTTFSVDTHSVAADGSAQATFTVSVKDINNNPVKDANVTLAQGTGNSIISSVINNNDGTYTFTATSTTAQTVTYTANVNGTDANHTEDVTYSATSTDVNKSTVSIDKNEVTADSSDKATITVTLKDANDNPITGSIVTLDQGTGSSIIGNTIDNGDGTYTIEVTSTTAEVVTYTAKADGVSLNPTQTVTFVAGSVGAGTSDVSVDTSLVAADGVATATITVTLKDENNNSISDATVTLDQDGSSNISTVTNHGDGTYTFEVNSTTAEVVEFTATANGTVITDTEIVRFAAGSVDADTSTVVASPTSVEADGTTASTITVTVKDANENLIDNASVTLDQGTGSSTISSVTNHGDGTYTFTVVSTTAQTVTYTATVNGTTITQTADVEFTASNIADANESNLTADQTTRVADAIETVRLIVTAKDANGNAMTDANVSIAQTGSSNIGTVINNGNGTYSFDVNSSIAETVTYTATINGTQVTTTVDVLFTPAPKLVIHDEVVEKVLASIYNHVNYTPATELNATIDNMDHNITFELPYTVTNGTFDLQAYTDEVILNTLGYSEDNETGAKLTFSWDGATLPEGNGTIIATIILDDTASNVADNAYHPTRLDIDENLTGFTLATFNYPVNSENDTNGTASIKILPGITDRNYEDSEHKFIYYPVTNTSTGKTWLNNNLGAEYTNINSDHFNHIQQATSTLDYLAFGSHFQWGRKADGHELIDWTDAHTGTPLYGTTIVKSDNPTDNLFILRSPNEANADWRLTSDDTLWSSEGDENNVCPIGYRVPTKEEWQLELDSWNSDTDYSSTSIEDSMSSGLKMTLTGYRDFDDGIVYTDLDDEDANIWSSTTVNALSEYLYMYLDDVPDFDPDGLPRAYGLSVRCIKEYPVIGRVESNETTVKANGTEEATITITIRDEDGNLISGAAVDVRQGTGSSSIGSIVDNGDGTYSFVVNSSTIETVTYIVSVNGIDLPTTVDVDFIDPSVMSIDNNALISIIGSVFDTSTYPGHTIDEQGIMDTTGLKVYIPYTVTGGVGHLDAYSQTYTILAEHTEDSENNIEVTLSWPAQTNVSVGSGMFEATLTMDDTAGNNDGIYNAIKLDVEDNASGVTVASFDYPLSSVDSSTGTLELKVYPAILDKNFNTLDNNGSQDTHAFMYLSISNPTTGMTWLNHNLGADYTNMNLSSFDYKARPTAKDDYLAYGSYIQWGRKTDGHDLITRVGNGNSDATAVYGLDSVKVDNPTHPNFIDTTYSEHDWRVNSDDLLWKDENVSTNVCPRGYRLPTVKEINAEKATWPTDNTDGAFNSDIKFVQAGARYVGGGVIANSGGVNYWTSGVSGADAQFLFVGTSSSISIISRGSALSVRCIKDYFIPDPLDPNMTIDTDSIVKYIVSVFDNTPYNPAIDIVGVMDNNSNQVVFQLPYTVSNASVNLNAYTYSTKVTIPSYSEEGEKDIVMTLSWDAQTLAVGSGTIDATITLDDTNTDFIDDSYYPKKLDVEDNATGFILVEFIFPTDSESTIGKAKIKIIPGIPDKKFGELDNNGQATHNFLYLPVINPTTGKTWLNNNLGADYSNTNSNAFNLTQQATSSTDYHAYGSLYQWGRKSDGHELVNYTDGTTGTVINGSSSTKADEPIDALFITSGNPYDWRVTQDDTLWAGEASANNVCPVGYRMPLNPNGASDATNEWYEETQTWESQDAAGALASILKLSMPGYRSYSDGTLSNIGTHGTYWTGSVSGTKARDLHFYGPGVYPTIDHYRAYGFSVRCIKD